MGMPVPRTQPSEREIAEFSRLINENRYDFCKLVYLIFPFGEPGHDLEHAHPYDWQMEEWAKLSLHLQNPITRYQTYRVIISSGNGAAKTAWSCMTLLMLMYTQRLRARVTANTATQLSTVVWSEMDIWFGHARYHDHFFDKFGTSIKAKNPNYAEKWKIDAVNWSKENPTAISGLHNKGYAAVYLFEEAPGIPAIIWRYVRGAFMDADTIKIFMAMGNSDDPESKFEQNMASSQWHSRRIDTRTLKHIDPAETAALLEECGGDEDDDDFRVRVRGLPRKQSRDSIIKRDNVIAAQDRAAGFDKRQVERLPCVLSCDPAWTGGDETVIWYRQGHYWCMLEKYRLNKDAGEDHKTTYDILCMWERVLRADAVFIDQGEGTAIWTYANQAGKFHWELIAFNSSPTDHPDPKISEYANIRAMMYYETNKHLQKGAILDVRGELDPQTRKEWNEAILKQLTIAKGDRHKTTSKKLVESKRDIKDRVDYSPDVADGCVLLIARQVNERLPENDLGSGDDGRRTGSQTFVMPSHQDPYEDAIDADYTTLYD